MAFTTEQTALLSAPLSRECVKTREQGGKKLSYIEGWKAIAEANRIFGFDGWHRETILLQETNRDLVDLKGSNGPYKQWRIGYIAKVRITVADVVREGTGYGSGMSKPEALGDAVEGAIKESETDAMKRALMTFGNPFGLALYDKEQTEVEDAKPVKPAAKASDYVAGPVSQAPPKQTAAQWEDDASKAISDFTTVVGLDAWVKRNNAALMKLHAEHATLSLYNALIAKIDIRRRELI